MGADSMGEISWPCRRGICRADLREPVGTRPASSNGEWACRTSARATSVPTPPGFASAAATSCGSSSSAASACTGPSCTGAGATAPGSGWVVAAHGPQPPPIIGPPIIGPPSSCPAPCPGQPCKTRPPGPQTPCIAAIAAGVEFQCSLQQPADAPAQLFTSGAPCPSALHLRWFPAAAAHALVEFLQVGVVRLRGCLVAVWAAVPARAGASVTSAAPVVPCIIVFIALLCSIDSAAALAQPRESSLREPMRC